MEHNRAVQMTGELMLQYPSLSSQPKDVKEKLFKQIKSILVTVDEECGKEVVRVLPQTSPWLTPFELKQFVERYARRPARRVHKPLEDDWLPPSDKEKQANLDKLRALKIQLALDG